MDEVVVDEDAADAKAVRAKIVRAAVGKAGMLEQRRTRQSALCFGGGDGSQDREWVFDKLR